MSIRQYNQRDSNTQKGLYLLSASIFFYKRTKLNSPRLPVSFIRITIVLFMLHHRRSRRTEQESIVCKITLPPSWLHRWSKERIRDAQVYEYFCWSFESGMRPLLFQSQNNGSNFKTVDAGGFFGFIFKVEMESIF